MTDGVTHHWVRITDEDLAYILDGPEPVDGGLAFDTDTWVDEVIDIIEDGLETA